MLDSELTSAIEIIHRLRGEISSERRSNADLRIRTIFATFGICIVFITLFIEGKTGNWAIIGAMIFLPIVPVINFHYVCLDKTYEDLLAKLDFHARKIVDSPKNTRPTCIKAFPFRLQETKQDTYLRFRVMRNFLGADAQTICLWGGGFIYIRYFDYRSCNTRSAASFLCGSVYANV